MIVASYNKDTNDFMSTIDNVMKSDKGTRISKDIHNISYELGLIESSLTLISSMAYDMPESFKLNDDTITDTLSGIINYLRRLLSDLDDATKNALIVKVRLNTIDRFYELCEASKVDDANEYATKLFDEVVNARYRTIILNK